MPTTNTSTNSITNSPEQVSLSFKKAVIDQFQIMAANRLCNYHEYLEIPKDSNIRHGDEANAVDQQFTRYTLEWLGFKPFDWDYNLPQPNTGQKMNRPDYKVRGSIGIAFIVEDKNSTIDFDDKEHLEQMRRYCLGTAGYAIWCNMRRILAVRFLPSNTLKHEILVDISVESLFGSQQLLSFEKDTQTTNLALFFLLFGKDRFTKFITLAQNIGIDEQTFEARAIPVDTHQATDNFINNSRQALIHLKLAALAKIQEAGIRRTNIIQGEEELHQEWLEAAEDLKRRVTAQVR